jgi:hypothetical protein
MTTLETDYRDGARLAAGAHRVRMRVLLLACADYVRGHGRAPKGAALPGLIERVRARTTSAP